MEAEKAHEQAIANWWEEAMDRADERGITIGLNWGAQELLFADGYGLTSTQVVDMFEMGKEFIAKTLYEFATDREY